MSFIKKNADSIYIVNLYDTPISLNAFITLVTGILLAISMVFFIPESLQAAGIVVLAALIGAYEINCFEFGKCSILAWGMASIYVIYALILLYAIYKMRKNPQELKQIFSKTMEKPFSFNVK